MLEPEVRLIGSQEPFDPQARTLAAANGDELEPSPLPSKRTLNNSNLPIVRTEKRAVIHHPTQVQRFSIEPVSWYEQVPLQAHALACRANSPSTDP